MRPIKTKPRFHCDFCSHTATEKAMEAHERICWMNPNRVCASCNGTGFWPADDDGLPAEPCYYCSKLTPESPASQLHPRLAALSENGEEAKT